MKINNSLTYRLYKWRIDKIFGIKKIVWFFLILMSVTLIPTLLLGQFIGKTVFSKSSAEIEYKTSDLKPDLDIETDVYSYRGNERGYIAIINNNSDIGYYPWVYTLQILNNRDEVVSENIKSSYLLPNRTNYIVTNIVDSEGIKINVVTDEELSQAINFDLDNSTLSELPEVKLQSTGKATLADNNTNILVDFDIQNKSIYKIKEVDLVYNIRNKDDRIIASGKYRVRDLISDEVRNVSLKHPNPKLGTELLIEVIPYTNYLDPNNYSIES